MEKVKKCIRCGEDKILSAFYKHPQMGDGHLNKCAKCCKEQAKIRHEKLYQKEEFVLSERERTRERYHRLNYKEKQVHNPEKKAKVMRVYMDKYPEKQVAKNISMRIKAPEGMQKHHWSYNISHAKDVIFLPAKEHARLHCYIVYDQERMMYRCGISVGDFLQNELLDTKEKHEMYCAEIKSKFIKI